MLEKDVNNLSIRQKILMLEQQIITKQFNILKIDDEIKQLIADIDLLKTKLENLNNES